ncbi:MAG: hypothetical protein V4633_01665 [Pseudomonadota bacterium]
MLSIVRASRALPVVCLALLGACGGSGSSGQPPVGLPIVIGEPPPAALDTVRYLAVARDAACADTRNRLYVIDNKFVFWDKAGNCADAAYSHTLFGATNIEPLCSLGDSIAGPMSRCNDESARPMFDIIVRNRDARDLGLGPSHVVRELEVPAREGSSLAFEALAASPSSGVNVAKNLVIRDAATLAEVWSAHTSNLVPRTAMPKVDFNTHMVLALFGGARGGCREFGLQRVTVGSNARLLAWYRDRDVTSVAVCTAMLDTPMHMVAIKKSDASVAFVKQSDDPVAYSALSRSGNSAMTQKAELVIRDAAAFDAMWTRHVNGQPDKPVVNFARQMVIAVFGGPGYNNGCHGMAIESIDRAGGKIHVRVVHWQPGPASQLMCTQAILFPAEMVVLDQASEEVSFSTETRYYP